MRRPTNLLYGADGDPGCTGHDEVAVLDVGPNLVQDEGDDVRLHGQEEHVALADRLLVAGGHAHPHFLLGGHQEGLKVTTLLADVALHVHAAG